MALGVAVQLTHTNATIRLSCRSEELRTWAFLFVMRLLFHVGLAPDLQEIASLARQSTQHITV